MSILSEAGYNEPYTPIQDMYKPHMDKRSGTHADFWSTDAAIEQLRQDMLRFARLQLRDATHAEDVVQEALSAAYASRENFQALAQFKTWVFAILRNKVIDLIRARARLPLESLTCDDGGELESDGLFNRRDHWQKQERPLDWGDPEAVLSGEQFWKVFELCLDNMTENTARVFTMRELLGLETDEICKELGISENNCWVILHRARSRLRYCLDENWFRGE